MTAPDLTPEDVPPFVPVPVPGAHGAPVMDDRQLDILGVPGVAPALPPAPPGLSRSELADRVLVRLFRHGEAPPTRKELKDAYPFGDRKGWPYKAWLSRVQSWRQAHGAGYIAPAPKRKRRPPRKPHPDLPLPGLTNAGALLPTPRKPHPDLPLPGLTNAGALLPTPRKPRPPPPAPWPGRSRRPRPSGAAPGGRPAGGVIAGPPCAQA
jgi:hypothetical protein